MAGFEALELLQLRLLALLVAHGARPRLVCRSRHEHRDAQLFRQRGQPVNVIGMLVRDQNS